MHEISITNILRRKWDTIALFVGLSLVLTLILTLVQPFKYSGSTRILIIQKAVTSGDQFNALRAVERISDNLALVVHTTSFFEKVMAAGADQINLSVFSPLESKKRQQWAKMVTATSIRGTGLLTIEVFHKDRGQALAIAQAVANVLAAHGWEYVGTGDIQVKIVDTPIASRWPTKPNVLANLLTGLILGLVLGGTYVFSGMRAVMK